MKTFKQYFLNEMGWNPRVQMQSPGDPSRAREHVRSASGGDEPQQNTLAAAKQLIDRPEAVNIQQAQQVLDDLGKSFDQTPNENLKQDIMSKYRELRELLKHKASTASESNFQEVAEECVNIAERLINIQNG